MLFAQEPAQPPWRDALALWSDILGVAAFLLSAAGVIIGWWINRRISRAKQDAKALIEEMGYKLIQQEVGGAKQSLEMARELCLSREWVRSRIYLDIALSQLSRLIQNTQVEDSDRLALTTGIDDARVLRDELREKKHVKQGDVPVLKVRHLDALVERLTRYEGRINAGFVRYFQ